MAGKKVVAYLRLARIPTALGAPFFDRYSLDNVSAPTKSVASTNPKAFWM